jgi:hypothetical protein
MGDHVPTQACFRNAVARASAQVSDTTIVGGGQLRHAEVSDTSSTGR